VLVVATLAAVGLLAVVLVRRPVVVAAIVVAVQMSGIGAAVGGPIGLSTIVLALAAATVVRGTRKLSLPAVRDLLRSPIWIPVAAFTAVMALSVTQAVDTGSAVGTFVDRSRDLVALVLVTLLLSGVRELRVVVGAGVLTIAALAGLSAIQEFALGNAVDFGGLSNVPITADVGAATARHSGPLTDVNFWGRLLVLSFPFALAMATKNRVLWGLTTTSLVVGVYLTGSRGALLALGVSAVAWMILTRPRPRTLVVLALVGGSLLAVPGVFTRLATLAALGGSDTAVVDPSLRNRAAVQVVGLAMARDHPVLGVGIGNFLAAEPEYQRRTGEAISEGVIAPHNLYLELLAEMGLLGLIAWLLLLGTAAFLAVRVVIVARRIPRVPGNAAAIRMGVAVLASLTGWSAASAVLHLSDFPALLTVVALAAVLDVRTRRAVAAAGPLATHPTPQIATGSRQSVGAVIVTIAAVLMAAGAVAELLIPARWTATVAVQVVPTTASSPSQAYAYDVRARDRLLPTYGAVLRSRGLLADAVNRTGLPPSTGRDVQVSSRTRYPSAVIDVRLHGANAALLAQLAPELVDTATDWLAQADSLYRLDSASSAVSIARDRGPLGGPPVLGAVAGAFAAGAAWLWRRHRRRSPSRSNASPQMSESGAH
jgi:O-antigen ligase/capsular polysaccharide biosynthesis protein